MKDDRRCLNAGIGGAILRRSYPYYNRSEKVFLAVIVYAAGDGPE